MPTRLLFPCSLVLLLSLLACGNDPTPAPTSTNTQHLTPNTPAATPWRTLAPMPTPRTEVAAAAYDGKIFVIGGFLTDGSSTGIVEIYDPAADTWSEGTPLPEPRHHAAATVAAGFLLVVGGYESSFSDAQSSVFLYSPAAGGAWVPRTDMPTARGALAAASADDGKLYAIGGADSEGRNVAAVEVFDLATYTWSTAADLPTPRDHLAAASVGGRIYAIGGRDKANSDNNVDTVEEYDPQTNAWTPKAPLPTARSGLAASVAANRILVVGGEVIRGAEASGTFDEAESYDPRTDTWRALAPLPTARHGLAAVTIADTIYVIAGGPTPGLSTTGANEAIAP